MAGKTVPPSTKLTSFNCAHCGTLTTQTWFHVYGDEIDNKGTPGLWSEEMFQTISENDDIPQQRKEEILEHGRRINSREIFFDYGFGNIHSRHYVGNLWVSLCYECDKLTVWLHDHILHPPLRHGVEPNEDLPEDVRQDYEEARTILDLSPRGAAALLRLAIQKLCVHLKEPGKNIDDDIASLVRKGLDVRVQRALDIVRVIGNESVHPGQMDLKDDRDTAVELLRLVNLIAEIMISQPKHVEAMYQRLPESKRRAIEKRDGKK